MINDEFSEKIIVYFSEITTTQELSNIFVDKHNIRQKIMAFA